MRPPGAEKAVPPASRAAHSLPAHTSARVASAAAEVHHPAAAAAAKAAASDATASPRSRPGIRTPERGAASRGSHNILRRQRGIPRSGRIPKPPAATTASRLNKAAGSPRG